MKNVKINIISDLKQCFSRIITASTQNESSLSVNLLTEMLKSVTTHHKICHIQQFFPLHLGEAKVRVGQSLARSQKFLCRGHHSVLELLWWRKEERKCAAVSKKRKQSAKNNNREEKKH